VRSAPLKKYFPESLALRLAHDAKPIRAIAALAPKVFKLARNDSAARSIVARGASHLADCALRVRRDLGLIGRTRLVCHGTLFKDDIFESGFQKRLAGRFVVARAATAADIAAARLR
jgi:N-acetylglucosamine kinase-like BadF-type ATPase